MLEHLRGRRSTAEFRCWSPWLESAARFWIRWRDEHDDDPFAYNETASVSCLVAAAAGAGYLSLADYVVTKGHADDRRWGVHGRCDFWLDTGRRDWAFEFKQRHAAATGARGLARGLERAIDCARCLRTYQGQRTAGLIVSLAMLEPPGVDRTIAKLQRLAQEVDHVWRIGPPGTGVYLFFRLC